MILYHMILYVYTVCHQVTSNGGIAALSIIHPKDLVLGLDEKKQLQDLEGILEDNQWSNGRDETVHQWDSINYGIRIPVKQAGFNGK